MGGVGGTLGRISVEVEGERWQRRATLDDSGPNDHHYVVIAQEGRGAEVEFGDGRHGQRPPTGSEIRVRYRSRTGAAHSRFVAVRLQEGRVVIDADWNEPAGNAFGVYRAVVTDNVDPLLTRRIRVVVPDVTGDDSVWAMACLPVGATDETPAVGDRIWVAFESGDPDLPVWLGRMFAQT